MMSGGAGAPAAAQASRIAARTRSAVSASPPCAQLAALGSALAQHRRGGRHARLGRALGAANAGQLGRRLDPPAAREPPRRRGRSSMPSARSRSAIATGSSGRHDRLRLDAHRAQPRAGQLERDLVARRPPPMSS